MDVPEAPEEVLLAAETISLWAKKTHHEAFRIGDVVYAEDFRDIRHLYLHNEQRVNLRKSVDEVRDLLLKLERCYGPSMVITNLRAALKEGN